VTTAPKIELRGDVLTVSGTTDLIDGSVLHVSMGRDEGDGHWEAYVMGATEVRDGRFSFQADVASIPGSKLYASIVFTFLPTGDQPSQPEHVKAKYGKYGQNLEGNHMHGAGDYRFLEYWLPVTS
jgi:hypothetical protein